MTNSDSSQSPALPGMDLANGIELSAVPAKGMLLAHLGTEAVLLVRPEGDDVFAIAPVCTHYGRSLSEGLLDGCLVRCSWHHAVFDARTGDAVAAPALDPVTSWNVERRGTRLFLGDKKSLRKPEPPSRSPSRVVIVGAGAAGNAAAEMLRREGYEGPVTMIGGDPFLPVDRTDLSKEYLIGTLPESALFLRTTDFYAAHDIELVLGKRVQTLDTHSRTVTLSDGSKHEYEALLLATGADPIQLPPASGRTPLFYLRSLADCKAIIARATVPGTTRAVVLGTSFIGLEVAASLRTRGLQVEVVGHENRPFERVLGPEIGDMVRALHEEHGVRFHFGRSGKSVEDGGVVLDDGSRLTADFVVAGIGVRPSLALAEQAGLRTDRGVIVDSYLETSAPGVFAAGDIARYTDPRTSETLRVEHWVVAERQGQAAARNMLGRRVPYRAIPFFWSQQYDVMISYVGHAEAWDRIEFAGSLAERSFVAAYRKGGRITALAAVNHDLDSLRAESLFEREDQKGLNELMAQLTAVKV